MSVLPAKPKRKRHSTSDEKAMGQGSRAATIPASPFGNGFQTRVELHALLRQAQLKTSLHVVGSPTMEARTLNIQEHGGGLPGVWYD